MATFRKRGPYQWQAQVRKKGQSLQTACEGDGRGYMQWMLGKDFSEELKSILQAALAGDFPRRE